MPGPGRRKTKAKKTSTGPAVRDLSNVDIPTVVDACVDQINDAHDWNAVAHLLCDMFNLPDLDSRSGLKKVHSNFEEIQRNLNAAYTKYIENDKVIGGIVGIWSKMSADSILRNKIFQGGLMAKLTALLDRPNTRLIGLQALSNVTHHGGVDIRREIAKSTPVLLRLMEEFPDDAAINEQVVVTLAHAVGSVVNDEDSPKSVVQANTRKLDIPRVLDLVYKNIKKPDASMYMLTHAIEFLCSSVLGCHKEIRNNPSVLNLLVALFRSNNLSFRVNALGAICRLVIPHADEDILQLDPNKFMSAIQRGFPSHLSDLLMNYNPMQCDTYLILYSQRDFTKAMMKCAQDKDLYALGKVIADCITRTEFSIVDGGFQAMNERTGRMELMDIAGLPFKMWSDSLPHCAKALRRTGNPADLDAADIVDCKFLVMRRRVNEAVALAQRAIERSPQVAYYYYIVGLGVDMAVGLRAAKKGLKAKKITPFVRHYLLWRAVDQAGQLGLDRLSASTPGDAQYEEGVAFFLSALEDAKTFVAETPPDNRNMRTVLNWYILLSLTINGPDLSVNLKELDHAMKKLDTTKEFIKFFGFPDSKTQLRLTREIVMERYQQADAEWHDFIAHMDRSGYMSHEEAQRRSAMRAGDNLAAWLEGIHVADDDPVSNFNSHHGLHPSLNSSSAAMLRCSYCHNPSAALRKCSGCAKTRYCDSACQKLHWSEHKVACKQAQNQG